MRDPRLQAFLNSLEVSLLESPHTFPGRHVAEMVFRALGDAPGEPQETESADLPVLECLGRAVEIAKTESSRTQPIGAALEPLLPHLPWRRSKGYDDPAFIEGHANAVLVGNGGLERRSDFTIGISLAAPNTAYPMHNHPPEELYLTMAGGEFRHGEDDWTRVGTGETFYNTPGIIHAMRATADPLLAIWVFGQR
jgi:quercetin dioxygenase-like cupin family protein